jgi:flagellar basal-body rod protein FlgF
VLLNKVARKKTMVKSIYTPLSGALAQEKVMDILANNLANMNTVGFKGDSVTFAMLKPEPEAKYTEPLPPANFKLDMEKLLPLKGNEISYVGVAGIHRDVSNGSAIATKNPLDLMIEGKGYFAVHTADGIRFTRAGDLQLDAEGILATKQGDPILGEKGVVAMRNTGAEINSKGEVYLDGKLVDKLQIYEFADEQQLERVGLNYYIHSGPEDNVKKVEFANVRQGFLESSNVNAIKNLTAMILAHRSFESYQKAIQNYDDMMRRSSNDLGRVQA